MHPARSLSVLLLAAAVAGCDRTELPTAARLEPVPYAAAPRASSIDPGTRILFSRNVDGQVGNFEIYSINPDGSDPQRLTVNDRSDKYPALSPDGSKILFTRADPYLESAQFEIYVMNADGTGQTNLTNNTAHDARASWSPDGTKIAFMSSRDGDYEIYVMDADGTDVVQLTNNGASDAVPTWSPDGTRIAFASLRDGGDQEIYIMNADGSGQANLTNHAARDFDPAWTSDGRIGFTSTRSGVTNHVYVMDADGTDVQQITSGTTWNDEPAWSPDGAKIAVLRNDDIWVMDSDGSDLVNVTSTAPGLASGTPNWGVPRQPPPDDLTRIVFASIRDGSTGNWEIYSMKPDGSDLQRLTDNQVSDIHPAQSPDRSRILFSRMVDGQFEIWVMNADGTSQTRLTTNAAQDAQPSWSPDGSRIVFTSNRDGDDEIYVMDPDGTDVAQLTTNTAVDESPAWSPDGTRIAFTSNRDGDLEVFVMNADGTGEPTNLTNNAVPDLEPTWTPDGRIGFVRILSGTTSHIFVMDADGTDVQQLTALENVRDHQPTWSPDGTRIAFDRVGNIWVMNADGSSAVNVTNTNAFNVPNASPDWGAPLPTSATADLEMLGNVGRGPGKTLQFTFAVRNLGPESAHDVQLTDPLPAAARFLGASTTQGSCSGPPAGSSGTITCALGTLVNGGNATVQITVKLIPANATVTNTAHATSTTTDPIPANNSLSLSTP